MEILLNVTLLQPRNLFRVQVTKLSHVLFFLRLIAPLVNLRSVISMFSTAIYDGKNTLRPFFFFFLQAYERRFPTCPQIPVFVGCEVMLDEESKDGAIRTTERRCKLNVEAPYILKKV